MCIYMYNCVWNKKWVEYVVTCSCLRRVMWRGITIWEWTMTTLRSPACASSPTTKRNTCFSPRVSTGGTCTSLLQSIVFAKILSLIKHILFKYVCIQGVLYRNMIISLLLLSCKSMHNLGVTCATSWDITVVMWISLCLLLHGWLIIQPDYNEYSCMVTTVPKCVWKLHVIQHQCCMSYNQSTFLYLFIRF